LEAQIRHILKIEIFLKQILLNFKKKEKLKLFLKRVINTWGSALKKTRLMKILVTGGAEFTRLQRFA